MSNSINSHASLVNAVAFELQQYVDVLERDQYYGVGTGNNVHLANYFSDTLKISDSSRRTIKNTLRDVGNTVQDEIAFLNNHSPFENINGKSINGFVNTYRSCIGLGTAYGSYLSDFGKYTNNPLYLPMCKYYVILSGRGERPSFLRGPHMTFENTPVPGDGGGAFVTYDGDGVILVANQTAEQTDVVIPPTLRRSILYYDAVERSSYAGWSTLPNGLNQLQMTSFRHFTTYPICREIGLYKGRSRSGQRFTDCFKV